MLKNEQLFAQIAELKQKFAELLFSVETFDTADAVDILLSIEHKLLLLAKATNLNTKCSIEHSTDLGSYIQSQLSWLAEQIELIKAQKAILAEQLLQISRARKGNASYDEHKSD